MKWLKWYYGYSNFCLERISRSLCTKKKSLRSLAFSLDWEDRSGSPMRIGQLQLLQAYNREERAAQRDGSRAIRVILLSLQRGNPLKKLEGTIPEAHTQLGILPFPISHSRNPYHSQGLWQSTKNSFTFVMQIRLHAVCVCVCVCVCVYVYVYAHAHAQFLPTLCDPMECSLLSSSFPVRILE